MIRLDGINVTLEIVTSTSAVFHYDIAYNDISASDTTPGVSRNALTAAGTVTALSAPAASVMRQIHAMLISSAGTGANTITIRTNTGGTLRTLFSATLQVGENIQYSSNQGFSVLDANGRIKTTSELSPGITGKPIYIFKNGTAAKGVGIQHCLAFASGFPGAWAPGNPGVAGRVTDGMSAADAGCLKLWTPTGSLFLMQSMLASTVAGFFQWLDFIWFNNGLVVTTTTAQTVNSVAWPARDTNGNTTGEGVNVAILVTGATTNAANITNITMTYTNSSGVANRTATMASFPLTAVVGTFVPFQLQAGDTGVQSIQSVTLGTSLVSGAISLVAYRAADSCPVTLINAGSQSLVPKRTGNRLYNGSCLFPVYVATATTALNLYGTIDFEER